MACFHSILSDVCNVSLKTGQIRVRQMTETDALNDTAAVLCTALMSGSAWLGDWHTPVHDLTQKRQQNANTVDPLIS